MLLTNQPALKLKSALHIQPPWQPHTATDRLPVRNQPTPRRWHAAELSLYKLAKDTNSEILGSNNMYTLLKIVHL